MTCTPLSSRRSPEKEPVPGARSGVLYPASYVDLPHGLPAFASLRNNTPQCGGLLGVELIVAAAGEAARGITRIPLLCRKCKVIADELDTGEGLLLGGRIQYILPPIAGVVGAVYVEDLFHA